MPTAVVTGANSGSKSKPHLDPPAHRKYIHGIYLETDDSISSAICSTDGESLNYH